MGAREKFSISGLSTAEALERQEKFGLNELVPEKKENLLYKLFAVLRQPMFLLLLVAATVYFLLGEPRDGAIMLIFVSVIITIEAIQESKTDRTLRALRDLSSPRIKVLRDGEPREISSIELVPEDIIFVSEGVKIPADGFLLQVNTLCVDESSLTGESAAIWKTAWQEDAAVTGDYWREDYAYAGTLVTRGTGTILVDKTGLSTEYGKIGREIAASEETPTPLQKQTGRLVQMSAGIAAVLFALVSTVTYFNIPDHPFKSRIIESILAGITLAMAMIPEEFPVILTVFLSMGAWRLARKNSLVRRLPAVETLGAVTVLCVDKTGTLTMNRMAVQEIYSLDGDEKHLVQVMGMACEPDAYDPMELAMLAFCAGEGLSPDSLFAGELLQEYPFTDESKMMGHVWKNGEQVLVAAKGSPEHIMALNGLDPAAGKDVRDQIERFSQRGLRVIAVAEMAVTEAEGIPPTLQQCNLHLLGLVALADPPRESVREDIANCTRAGVRVVMITGDSGLTSAAIARKIGLPGSDNIINGAELCRMDDRQLGEKVQHTSIFSRVLPEHKMRIVQALQQNGEIVAMTGDGVNDAPALKRADIGIAMGQRGSDVTREAADLVLLDDNFSTIVQTIEDGRRIYDNIRKAVGYVFTIHIPIALAALLAPLLKISPAALLLLPLHVVLLELVIDPTCSIVLERQPAERDIMQRPPRDPGEKILTADVLLKSLIQGLAIFLASFGMYYYFITHYPNEPGLARSMGISIILFSNLLLVQVNSSHLDFAIHSFLRQVKDRVMWTIIIVTISGFFVIIYSPLNEILRLAPLSAEQVFLVLGASAAAVLWYEVYKLARFIQKKRMSSGGGDFSRPAGY